MSPESAAVETPRVVIGGATPDPLTAAQLLREVGALEKQVTQRMDAIEKAVAVAHDDLVRAPTDLRIEITALRELLETKLEVHAEKFNGVERQFRERDTRIEQTAKDAKTAIDAALLAAEKAVGKQQDANNEATRKSDFSFTKQIDQQGTLIAAVRDGLDRSITELKERIASIQAIAIGKADQRTETRETTTDKRDDSKFYIAVIALIASIAGIAIGYFANR